MVLGEGGKQTAEKKKKNRTRKVLLIKKEFDNWMGGRVKENKKGGRVHVEARLLVVEGPGIDRLLL
jgi:hypothetical protein